MLLSFFPLTINSLGDPFNNTILSINPATQTVDAGDNFTIDVYCVPGQPIKAFEFKLTFDETLVTAIDVTEGNIFNGYTTFFNSGTIDNSSGTIVDVFGLILGAGNTSSAGSLANGIIVWEKSLDYQQKLEKILSKINQGGNAIIKETINFDDLFSKLWLIEKNIKNNKVENIRLLIWDIAIGICHRLAGINNQYYLNNWGKQLREIDKFTIKPNNFSERFKVTKNR